MEGPEGSENLRDDAESQAQDAGGVAGGTDRRRTRTAGGSAIGGGLDTDESAAPEGSPGAEPAAARPAPTTAREARLGPAPESTPEFARPVALLPATVPGPGGDGAGDAAPEQPPATHEEPPPGTVIADRRDADGWPLAASGSRGDDAFGWGGDGATAVESTAGGVGVPGTWPQPDDANVPRECRFLRSLTQDARLGRAGTYADPGHRCAAFGEPLALSTRQQQLVCLAPVHVSCPRYLRGTLLSGETEPEADRGSRRIPVSIAASLILLLASIAVSFLGVASGMIRLPGEGPGLGSASLAANVMTPGPTASPSASLATASPVVTASPVATASHLPTATPAPTPTATPAPTPTPTPAATPTPRPTATWPPGATASRMSLLSPCTDGSGCWVYVIRHGDKFYEITFFFGVSSKTVLSLNPWLTSTASMEPYVGRRLVIPPPTK